MCVLCRSGLQCSKLFNMNCASVFVLLPDQCNILSVNTVKTLSSPPSSDSSVDNKKQEKRIRRKTVNVNARISEHDLKIKLNHMSEWLGKGYNVSVFILKTSNKQEVSCVHCANTVRLYKYLQNVFTLYFSIITIWTLLRLLFALILLILFSGAYIPGYYFCQGERSEH